jgi:hypothetical protein
MAELGTGFHAGLCPFSTHGAPIEDLKIGDLVWSPIIETHNEVSKSVNCFKVTARKRESAIHHLSELKMI